MTPPSVEKLIKYIDLEASRGHDNRAEEDRAQVSPPPASPREDEKDGGQKRENHPAQGDGNLHCSEAKDRRNGCRDEKNDERGDESHSCLHSRCK